MRISSNFDGGSIGIIDAANPSDIRLRLLEDNAAEFRMWFYFRVAGAKGQKLNFTIVNAGESNANKGLVGMPEPWPDYRVLASYDREEWFRLPTSIDGTNGHFSVTPDYDAIYIANFTPYSMERHQDVVANALLSPRGRLHPLGLTPDGQDFDLLQIGEPGPGKKKCWFMTRQHPNETQGAWCIEGVIERLLDEQDPLSRALLQKAVFYVVPNMNPDGSRRGNTRTNALGSNLNREWQVTTDKAPEVAMVKAKMVEWGLDFCLDAHAWSGTYNYACGPYHTPSVTPKQTALWKRYERTLAKCNPDFEEGWPYPGGGPAPGQADLAMSWNYISETFGAIGVLYELIYKDTRDVDEVYGFSAERAKKLGYSTLDALYEIVDDLGPEKGI